MHYKVLFHAYVDGQKKNLEAVFDFQRTPDLKDKRTLMAAGKAAMQALSETVDINGADFSIEYHLDAILPITK
ncbi:hypothetical protein ACMS0D_001643 [Cronobacter turicensis]